MSSYVTLHLRIHRFSAKLLKISKLVAIAATLAIVCTVGGVLGIRPRITVPTNGPGQPNTANSFQ
jgi:hypothetical protein